MDRLVAQAWTLSEVVAELGAAPSTVRRLLDHDGVRRVVPARRQRAAAQAARGPQTQARAFCQRRQARLAELGFAEVGDYLRDRHVRRGWSVRRLCAELGAGHAWMDKQPRPLGLRDLPIGLARRLDGCRGSSPRAPCRADHALLAVGGRQRG